MPKVKARIASVTVRTIDVTRSLLKQCRIFTKGPPKPFCEEIDDDLGRLGLKVLPEFAVGWFRGTVLGDEDNDYVLFARDGDLALGRFPRTYMRWRLPPEVKQLYIV